MTEKNPLVSVVYCSSATRPFRAEELGDLLEASRAHNSEHDITGMLLYRSGEFVQILEGPRSGVDALMEKIGRDPRHTDVRVLIEEPLHERRFADWTMGYQSLVAPRPEMLEGYRDSFDDLRVGDHDMIGRAIMELTLWFRVRESGALRPH